MARGARATGRQDPGTLNTGTPTRVDSVETGGIRSLASMAPLYRGTSGEAWPANEIGVPGARGASYGYMRGVSSRLDTGGSISSRPRPFSTTVPRFVFLQRSIVAGVA